MFSVNAATGRITGPARPAICAIRLETPWKDVEEAWTKLFGDGTLKATSASAGTGWTAGDATTATFATPREINANAEIKKRTGDAISVTKISD